jgi:hypothetical protein
MAHIRCVAQQKEPKGRVPWLRMMGSVIGVLLFVSAWFYCCLVWPVEAVETPKHGYRGLGQHLAKDTQREETALHMAPSEGQTGQRCAMIRNAG